MLKGRKKDGLNKTTKESVNEENEKAQKESKLIHSKKKESSHNENWETSQNEELAVNKGTKNMSPKINSAPSNKEITKIPQETVNETEEKPTYKGKENSESEINNIII